MTDEPATPAETTPGPIEPAPVLATPALEPAGKLHSTMPATAERSNTPLVLSGIACVIAIVAAVWAWRSVDAANGQVTALQGRVAALEQRPLPAPAPNLQPIEARLDALEKRPVADLGPLNQQIAALQQRITAVDNKPPPQASLDNAGRTEIAALAGRVDQTVARQTQLGTQEQADLAKMADQITALNTQIAAATKASGQADAMVAKAGQQIDALAGQQTRTAQLGAAAVALAAGRPLGDIPNAPPALAQFATKPPPTEAALRLSFDQAADAAQDASRPAPSDKPFLDRLWARAQSSVTVKQGDRVLLGSPISSYLESARRRLDAGDIAGALAALNGLDGPAAAAMAGWRQQAQSLLDARAALLAAAHG